MKLKNIVLTGLILFLGCSSCLLFQPGFKDQWKQNSQETYDVIIVPGIPYEPPTWNRIMKARVQWAVWLYQKGITKNIIFSGSAVHTPYSEAKIMSLYAQAMGVPEENIYLETQAEHGSENLYFGNKQAKDLGFKKIALATDPYQGALMFKHNRKFDIDIPFLPTLFDTIVALDWKEPTIDYNQALIEDFTPLSERKGKVEQYQSSMGKRVKQLIKAERKAQKKADKEAKSNNR